jgi:putrescine transport system substrate-binding protein
MRASRVAGLALALLGLAASVGGAPAQEKVVRIYNWSDYIDPVILEDFTKETGIKVVYDVYDSNDILETKLLAGSSGYDLVVPTAYFLARQIQAGIFAELDRSKIPNLANLDPALMERVSKFDPGNAHGVIWMWGTTGFAYNVDKIRERMPDAPVDSWRMLLDPGVVARFADCGVYMLDSGDEGVPTALNYLGLDPNSTAPADLERAQAALLAVRPHIRKFHSSENINALANGDICLAQIYSGDAGIAATRAEEAGNGVKVEYTIPKEGAPLWFDVMAIPKDAPSPENAHAFINYVLQPEVIAKATNFVTYPNAVPASKQFVEQDLIENPNVYPPEDVLKRLYVKETYGPREQRAVTRLWQTVTTGG